MSKTWEVNKDELEQALDLLLRVPPRNGFKSSEYIRISNRLSLSAEISGVVRLRGAKLGDKLYIDRRLFEPFVSSGRDLKFDTYVFELGKHTCKVIHGPRTVEYARAVEPISYGEPPKYDSNSLEISKRWRNLLRCATACSSFDPSVPNLNCVYMVPTKTGIGFYASNSVIAFYGHVSTKKRPSDELAFPILLAKQIDAEYFTKVRWDNKSALLEANFGSLWQPVKTEARKSFPKKEIALWVSESKKLPSLFSIEGVAMADAIGRIAAYLTAVTREDLLLHISVRKGTKKAVLTAGTGSTRFEEYVGLLASIGHDEKVEWPLREILPVLQHIGQEKGPVHIKRMKSGQSVLQTDTITVIFAEQQKRK